MKEFTGFIAVDGTCFTDNDEARQYEDQLADDKIAGMSATRLVRSLAGNAPHLYSQVRAEVLRQIGVSL